jgi:hypothetical protein
MDDLREGNMGICEVEGNNYLLVETKLVLKDIFQTPIGSI